ncbi:sulfotransferase family protein [Roseobacter sp.]|uniref:sulfotransferase family protein n=1 Tax=Roseobacter sp. TaxID=1907202 RepID=UPI00385FB20F
MTKRVLILGFPRSGTTLLAKLLAAHTDVSCPPETHLYSAAARFLHEQTDVEGPPIGVLTGLGFLDIEAEEVMQPLRRMVFDFHDRIADGAPVQIDQTAVDIFHLETLEKLLKGHAYFICLTRNPLDVIASNKELTDVLGAPLSDLAKAASGSSSPYMGVAQAWAERQCALDTFAERNAEACHCLRYEDLTGDPDTTLAALFDFLGLTGEPQETVRCAFDVDSGGATGLGDFRIHTTAGLRPPDPNGWRKRLPRAAASRLLPVVAPLMEAHGYKVPKMPALPDRDTAIRQFRMAAEMKRRSAGRDDT